MQQSRSFLGVLYPDSASYDFNDVLDKLDSTFSFWAYCMHDKDLAESGDFKKPHVHWVGKYETPRTLGAVARKLGVPENSIEYCKSLKRSVRYLIHKDNKTKYQYPLSSIESSSEIFEFFDDKDGREAGEVLEILNYIAESNCKKLSQLVHWVAMNGYWSTYRRCQSTFIQLIREQNAMLF